MHSEVNLNYFNQWNTYANTSNFTPTYNLWAYAPMGNYNYPSLWNTGFGSWHGSSSSSSSYTQSTEQKREETIQKSREIKAQLKEIRAEKSKSDKVLSLVTSAKEDKNGQLVNKETLEDYKKHSWWKKTLRAAGNMVQGTWKMIEGFAGIERNSETEKRSFKPLKLLKNIGIAAALIGLTMIPGIGPFITAGLLATGVITGSIGMTKGIVKACNAKSVEEVDNAFQDIGQGLAVGISSAVGLRGLGKGFRMTNTAADFSSSATKSSIAKFLSKPANFFKDMTVNAFKATKSASVTQKKAITSEGFWTTFRKNIKNELPKFGKKKFTESMDKANKAIDVRINQIDAELNELSSSYTLGSSTNMHQNTALRKALLEDEKITLSAQKVQINSSRTKIEWEFLKKKNCVDKTRTNLNKIQSGTEYSSQAGTTANITDKNIDLVRDTSSRLNTFSKQVQQLVNTRKSTMKFMSLNKKNATEINSYTGANSKNMLSRFYRVSGPNKNAGLWANILHCIKAPIKLGFNAICITFKPYQLLQYSPASTWYKIESTFIVPVYEAPMVKNMFGMGDKTVTVEVTQKDENGKEVTQKVAVTKDMLAQIKETNKSLKNRENELKKKLESFA